MNKRGFTLIESLIYITCATIMCLLTASFVSNIYLNSTKNIKFVDRYFEIYRAHDFIVSYLQSAPVSKSSWEKLDCDNFIFKINNKFNNNTNNNLALYIGFHVDKKNRILKKTGNYNPKNSSWSDSGYSILLQNCDLEFIPDLDAKSGNIIIGANLILRDKIKPNIYVKRFVSFCVGNKL